MIRRALIFAVSLLWPAMALSDDVQSVRYLLQDGVATAQLTGAQTTVDTPFTLASVGKLMTSVAVLQLVDQGAVGLDDPVSDYVSDTINDGLGGLEDVSLRHLLTMTSGLPDYYGASFQRAALDNQDKVQNAAVALSYAFDEEWNFEPGTDFDYANTNYVLLGLIIENVTGQSYSAALQSAIFDPLGMDDSFVFGSKPLPAAFPQGQGYQRQYRAYYEADGFGDGGVISTAPDLARFYTAIFRDNRLLSDQTRQALLTDPIGVGYGMGVEVSDHVVGHSGGDLGYVTDVRMDRKTGTIAIILIADGDGNTSWTLDQMDD